MFEKIRRWLAGRTGGATGAAGERIAARWLRRSRGFRIVVRNWRSPADRRDEIDIVAWDGPVLVFVEVKTRAADALVPGYHAVDARKKTVLRRAIAAYLQELRHKPRTFRFDVVEVSWSASQRDAPVVLHFEAVPLFSKQFLP